MEALEFGERPVTVRSHLCRAAEGLSYKDIALVHRHPPTSPQKSDTVRILFKVILVIWSPCSTGAALAHVLHYPPPPTRTAL